jgi:hypothetical protein
MSFQDWLTRGALLRRLVVLGTALGQIESRLEELNLPSSKTTRSKLVAAEKDYWRAIDAFREDRLADTRQATSAAFLQLEFLRALVDSEAAESELGQGKFFELSEPPDREQDSQRIKNDLQAITVELSHLLETTTPASGQGG